MEENRGMDMEIRHSVSAAGGNWKKCSGMLSDRKKNVRCTSTRKDTKRKTRESQVERLV